MGTPIEQKKKIALVLSGGGIKAAAFHMGVCLALRQKGFTFRGGSKLQVSQSQPPEPKTIQLYVGSSAGAFMSALLASGYDIDTIIDSFQVGILGKPKRKASGLPPIRYRDIFRLNGSGFSRILPGLLSFHPRQRLLSHLQFSGGFETLLKDRFQLNGFFTTKGLAEYLSTKALPFPHFQDLGVELFVVGTQLNHSRKVIFGKFPDIRKDENLMFINNANIAEAVAASVALPPVFAPYGIPNPEGKIFYFYDGEIRDTLSTHVAADHGADLIISSSSIQPYHYTEKVGSLHRFGLPVIINQALYQVIQQKIERHKKSIEQAQATYDAIHSYCKHHGISDEHREKILDIVRQRLNLHPDVDYIDISPRPRDVEMFFADHFSLKPNILETIIKIGFKSALAQLRHY